MAWSVCFLIQFGDIFSEIETTTMVWTLPNHSIIKKLSQSCLQFLINQFYTSAAFHSPSLLPIPPPNSVLIPNPLLFLFHSVNVAWIADHLSAGHKHIITPLYFLSHSFPNSYINFTLQTQNTCQSLKAP